MNDNRIIGTQLHDLLKQRKFDDIFLRLGWDCEGLQDIPPLKTQEGTITAKAIAEKRGFVVCVCEDNGNLLTSTAERKKITTQLARYHYEHLLIIHDKDRQCWTLAIRPQDRPMQTAEADWHRNHKDPRLLAEKLAGIFFDISEEGELYLGDVVEKVRSAFMQNHEQITRRFYTKFQKELERFADFIEGLQDRVAQKWYSALTLNRLMFIYFLQKRGFLDSNKNYLKDKLQETQQKHGKDQFERTFYRKFLRQLFAEGLGAPAANRPVQLQKMLGKVPYLNGGLFDLHDIEKANDKIDIPDEAFENLFAFFDNYQWHLDTRPMATGNEINPDVIGYIFEKYINDRAKMGAYYTQEDVTGYIARSSIIPFLLEQARKENRNAFNAETGIWRFLRKQPHNFIYDAVQKGCNIPDSELPQNIRHGLDTKKPNLKERRTDWNNPADPRFALPGEIWRETIARRIRCNALIDKMKSGGITRTEDLITRNLDIQRFAAVALESYEGTDFVEAFFTAIAGKPPRTSKDKGRRGITVLDPACGSGAFLFAALNVLEPLYEKCLQRMREFVEEDDTLRQQGKRKGAPKHPQFRKTLADIKQHTNENYWIYKQIILNNLYGVDLMREAAEIAKLRLFLKLAAAAGDADPTKDNFGLEPLPDIDFNIRSGNSLVGFAGMTEFNLFAKRQLRDKNEQQAADDVRENMKLVNMADIRFRQAQEHDTPQEYQKAKRDLGGKLDTLNNSLNQYLAAEYGKKTKANIAQWQETHRPFHWLANFYDIIENHGGFDVVIGNPPYIEYSKVKKGYTVRDYRTEKCGNIYAMFIERAFLLGSGTAGMIVQLPLVCTDGMAAARKILIAPNRATWFSNYDDSPGKLFDDMPHIRASVFLSMSSSESEVWATRYQRWHNKYRDNLFPQIAYGNIANMVNIGFVPKVSDEIGKRIYARLAGVSNTIAHLKQGQHFCHYHNAPHHWTRATDFVPYFWNARDGEKPSTQIVNLAFANQSHAKDVIALLNSSLFYYWYLVCSDCRHLNKREVNNFPFMLGEIPKQEQDKISKLVKELMADYRANAARKTTHYRTTGDVIYDEFHPRHSKPIIDQIDTILAPHYNLTAEELDYIINYDIKYRQGKS